ncbi:MAG: Uma2 family endonuclease [Thermoanaerobaculia bacterium]|nr:Uma2 family endonuclease [Thermoanaerobaculia bacterium]
MLKPLTIDEFLDWDGDDDRRYELVGGVPVVIPIPSGAHQIIAANLAHHLAEALDEHPPCHARYGAPIEIAGRADTCHVADLAVTCQPHEPGQKLTPEPLVIVEILSPSTERRDRKVKLPDYRAIPTVVEIVLLDQQEPYCEVHRRLDDGRWLVDLLRWPDARLRLESIGFDQPLAAIYAGIGLGE